MDKQILRHIGESSAYTAKGHFKTADLRLYATYLYITLNFALSIVCLTDFFDSNVLKVFSIVSLFASILLLINETHGGLSICKDHKKFADQYLELHNDVYFEFLRDDTSQDKLMELKERLNDLNRKVRPNISYAGKVWAKIAIEKQKEMNNWWK